MRRISQRNQKEWAERFERIVLRAYSVLIIKGVGVQERRKKGIQEKAKTKTKQQNFISRAKKILIE